MKLEELKVAVYEQLERKKDPDRMDHQIFNHIILSRAIYFERVLVAEYIVIPDLSGQIDVLVLYPGREETSRFNTIDDLTTFMLQ